MSAILYKKLFFEFQFLVYLGIYLKEDFFFPGPFTSLRPLIFLLFPFTAFFYFLHLLLVISFALILFSFMVNCLFSL